MLILFMIFQKFIPDLIIRSLIKSWFVNNESISFSLSKSDFNFDFNFNFELIFVSSICQLFTG